MQKIVQNYHGYICCYGKGYMERIFRIKNGIKIFIYNFIKFGCGRDLSEYFWTKKAAAFCWMRQPCLVVCICSGHTGSNLIGSFRPFGIHPRTV